MQSFSRQHVNGSQTLLRSARKQLHTTLPLIRDRGSRKWLFLIRSELLAQFVDTLTADYKYSRQNWENLSQQFPRPTSRKAKKRAIFFVAFLKFTLNLEYFEKKYQSHSLSINEIIKCEKGSYLNVQKAIFHATLRQITCYRIPNTADISTKPVSYHYSFNPS